MVAPSVKILGLDSVAVAGSDGRSVRFTIKEINGIDVKLNPPTLAALSLKDGDKSLQAQFENASMVHVAVDGEHPINSPFTVAGKQAYPIRMYITGLNAPGQYSASLDIGTDDGSLDAQIVTIFVKRSFWIALLSIAAGVLISVGLRKYTTENRPRLLLRRQLSLLKNDIDNLGSRLFARSPSRLQAGQHRVGSQPQWSASWLRGVCGQSQRCDHGQRDHRSNGVQVWPCQADLGDGSGHGFR
jgi:hypothetical protein